MRQINWKGQDIPVHANYDVIVIGGGTAGALAGIAAAREGRQTLIIEQFGSLGGSATMGQVTPLMTSGIPHLRSHCPLGLKISARIYSCLKFVFRHIHMEELYAGRYMIWFSAIST